LSRQPQNLQRKPQYEDWVINNLPMSSALGPNVGSTFPLFEGDLCWWNATNGGVEPINSGTLGTDANFLTKLANYMGISNTTVPLGYNPNDVLATGGIPSGYYGALGYEGIKVIQRCIADLYTTPGDTYKLWDQVTVGANAQTVVKVATVAPAVASAVASSTGGTLSVGVHNIQVGYYDHAGNLILSPATTVTVASGNIVTITSAAIPAWASGAVAIVDGFVAGEITSGTSITVSAPPTEPVPPAQIQPITVGIVIPSASNYTSMVATGQAGVTNTTVRIALRSNFPDQLDII
jgi:hypothetical protein